MLYIVFFAGDEFVNFRCPELTSICSLYGVECDLSSDAVDNDWQSPFVILDFADDCIVQKICRRSLLIKAVYKLWASAETLQDLLTRLNTLPADVTGPILNSPEDSFKISVINFNRRISQEDKLTLINNLMQSFSGEVTAPISLTSAKNQIGLLVEYSAVRSHQKSTESPLKFYCGPLVCESNRKSLLTKYSLAERTFLGNTSMNVCLAGISANLACCTDYDLVYDPFVGSGGCLIGASDFGSFGFGSDIDYALLHGLDRSPRAGQGARKQEECLKTCYRQYNMQSRFLDVFVGDAALVTKCLRAECLFDAIITDPPYGVREACKRVAKNSIERNPGLLPESMRQPDDALDQLVPHDLPHFAHKEMYPLYETFRDLLQFAADRLKPHGRIVFWIPMTRELYKGFDCLPRHPRLRLLHACEQVLNQRNSRFLLTMERLGLEEPDQLVTHDAGQTNLETFVYLQPHAKQKIMPVR